MKLLTEELKKKLPPLYATENVEVEDKVALIKFFHPMSSWTWYVVEGGYNKDLGTWLFFGLVDGFESEWGYFTLQELETTKVHGLGIERDLYWKPKKLREFHPRYME